MRPIGAGVHIAKRTVNFRMVGWMVHDLRARPLPNAAIGMVGGLIVGLTSVGSGSSMIVLRLAVHPMRGADQLVGTDLTQAVPLTMAAALGALAFVHVEFSVTTSIVIGRVPAVSVGALLSSRAPDRCIRPAITFVIFASGLTYIGVGTTVLSRVLCATLLVTGAVTLACVRPWRASRDGPDDDVGDDGDDEGGGGQRDEPPVPVATGPTVPG